MIFRSIFHGRNTTPLQKKPLPLPYKNLKNPHLLLKYGHCKLLLHLHRISLLYMSVRQRTQGPIKKIKAYFNITIGLAITIFAIVGLFSEGLGLETSVSRNLVYFYSAVALLYGPFRIWRGVTDLRGSKYENV